MAELAAACEPADLYRRRFRLYEQFRPGVPAGKSGWGTKGELDLAKVRALVRTDSGRPDQANLTVAITRIFSRIRPCRPMAP